MGRGKRTARPGGNLIPLTGCQVRHRRVPPGLASSLAQEAIASAPTDHLGQPLGTVYRRVAAVDIHELDSTARWHAVKTPGPVAGDDDLAQVYRPLCGGQVPREFTLAPSSPDALADRFRPDVTCGSCRRVLGAEPLDLGPAGPWGKRKTRAAIEAAFERHYGTTTDPGWLDR